MCATSNGSSPSHSSSSSFSSQLELRSPISLRLYSWHGCSSCAVSSEPLCQAPTSGAISCWAAAPCSTFCKLLHCLHWRNLFSQYSSLFSGTIYSVTPLAQLSPLAGLFAPVTFAVPITFPSCSCCTPSAGDAAKEAMSSHPPTR